MINLRADSITGTILATTSQVSLPTRFSGPVDFLFSNPVSVTPGMAYYFQPVLLNNNNTFGLYRGDYGYVGGTGFLNGNQDIYGWDLWFRQGIINVPEPSSAAFVLLGLGGLVVARRFRGTSHTR